MAAAALALTIATTAAAAVETSPAQAFLDRYMAADGRVVRLDQGGDTVSEGQAYAMLAAVAVGDRADFDSAWRWARDHLARPDGLMSWLWRNGGVVDVQAATDADLDAAHALVMAGRKFGDASLVSAGVRMGAAVLDHETLVVAGRRVLAAGPWAVQPGRAIVVNPSYTSPAAFSVLASASGDGRWNDVASTTRDQLNVLTKSGRRLPPDWAVVGTDGRVSASSSASSTTPGKGSFGFDAVRVPIRLAVSCNPTDRSLAWALRPTLSKATGGVASHPVMGVARAASAFAGGDTAAASSALAGAETANSQSPTYYGSAWVGLYDSWSRSLPCS